MSYPQWPETDDTVRRVGAGFECTSRTTYDIRLSATEEGPTEESARSKANNALSKRVNQRKSF